MNISKANSREKMIMGKNYRNLRRIFKRLSAVLNKNPKLKELLHKILNRFPNTKKAIKQIKDDEHKSFNLFKSMLADGGRILLRRSIVQRTLTKIFALLAKAEICVANIKGIDEKEYRKLHARLAAHGDEGITKYSAASSIFDASMPQLTTDARFIYEELVREQAKKESEEECE